MLKKVSVSIKNGGLSLKFYKTKKNKISSFIFQFRFAIFTEFNVGKRSFPKRIVVFDSIGAPVGVGPSDPVPLVK